MGLDPGRNPKAGRTLHRRHLDLGAERGIREGDGQLEDEVIPVPYEPMVGSDMDGHVKVTGRSARVPREATARDPKLDAIRHAFRDLDRDRPPLLDPTLAGAPPARAFRPLTPAVAFRARRDRDELAVTLPLGRTHLPPTAARRARHEALPLGPRPSARGTGHRILDRDLFAPASGHVLERDLEVHPGVPTRRRSPPSSDRTASEEILEQSPTEAARPAEDRLEEIRPKNVLDVLGMGEPGPVEALATPHLLLEPVRPELIVDLPLLVVAEDLVGLGELLELLLRDLRIVLVQVRMIFLGEAAVGVLDLVLRRPTRDAQDAIVVRVAHTALTRPVTQVTSCRRPRSPRPRRPDPGSRPHRRNPEAAPPPVRPFRTSRRRSSAPPCSAPRSHSEGPRCRPSSGLSGGPPISPRRTCGWI